VGVFKVHQQYFALTF